MNLVTSVVLLLLFGGAAATVTLGVVLWRRRVSLGGPEVVGFAGLAVGATIWSWAYALQLRATTLPEILGYNNVLWIGVGVVGAAWPIFGFAVAGDDRWLTRRRLSLVSGVPLVFAVLAVSNPAHRLIYSDVRLVDDAIVRSSVTPEIGFFIFLAWSLVINVYVLWRLAVSCRRAGGIARSRRLAVLAAGLVPTLAGIVGLLLFPDGGPPIDFTPVMFSVTTIVTGVAITRYRLLDSIAVAQDHLVDHLSDPVVIVDADETIRATNESATRLFRDGDPVGRPIDGALRDQPALVEAIRTRPATGTTAVVTTVESTHADGERTREHDRGETADDRPPGEERPDGTVPARRTFEVSVGSLGRTDATVLVFRDVTERRAAERRVEVLNRVLRHDLRNDLSVIDGYLDLLEEELSGVESEAARGALDVLSRRTDGMLSVVEQAALAETVVEGDTEFERFDLTAVVRDRCEQVRVEHPEVRLDASLPDGAVTVSAVSALPSVVDNLIENAIEHSDRDRPELVVRLVADPSTSTVEFLVADDGAGIPSDDRAVLVGTDPSLEDANGLGLWLINQLTMISGGSVDVEDREGGGTSVSVTLPLAAAESTATSASPTA